MSILVQKYGGSSVADVQKIGLVADRVVAARREGHDVVVVVSAMGKTTDGLIELARKAAASHPATGEPPRRELDMLVSTGERVTMALLSIAIHARGCDAISFTGSQSGILTNDRHFDARIIEVRPHRIQDELARGRIVIVAGYQGMSYKREITTLGRGGSDTTAVALAAALGACRCEIYSDVDGVYSADPRVVPDAKHLPELDLAVLAEMAEAGAKVLNAQAVSWARRNKVAIVARRTSDTDGTGRETIAVASENDENRNVRAVVGGENIMLLRIRTHDLSAFLAVAEGEELTLGDVVANEDSALVHLPLLSVPDWERCRCSFERALSDRVGFLGKCAIASLVGHGLTGAGRVLPQMLATLSRLDVKPQGLYAGPLRISVTVQERELSAVQRALHDEFIPSV